MLHAAVRFRPCRERLQCRAYEFSLCADSLFHILSSRNAAMHAIICGMKRFIAFGEILFDCFNDHSVLGGAPLNVAYHAASLGMDSMIISAVGDDELGHIAIESIKEKRIDTSSIAILRDVPTGRADITMNGKDADYEFNCPAAWDEIPYPEHLPECTDVIYFGTLAQRSRKSRKTLKEVLSSVKAGHVFFDVNIRKDFYTREIIEEGLRAATILKMNEDELPLISSLLGIGGNSIERLISGYSLEMILLTEGKKGTTLYSSDGSVLHQDTRNVAIVDTVGAGDSLSGGFIAALVSTGDKKKAVRLGSMLADFVVTRSGGTPEYTKEVKEAFRLSF